MTTTTTRDPGPLAAPPQTPGPAPGLVVDIEVARRPHTVNAAFSVAAGQRLALFGPSGAGKTTLLEVVAGITRPDRALISMNGRILTRTDRPKIAMALPERRVGLLRQPPGLFPHLSVAQNAGYATGGTLGAEGNALLDDLGLASHAEALPVALSGGQRQRVALARVLLGGFDLLLLDEPFTGLDAVVRARVNDCVRRRADARQAPVILVTPDLPEAQAFAHTLGIVDGFQLLQLGDAHSVVAGPASRRVAELVGYRGFVPGHAVGAGPGVVCVHPQRVRVGEHPRDGVVMSGVVASVRPSGGGFEADLLIADRHLVACAVPARGRRAVMDTAGRLDPDAPDPYQPGERLTVTALDPPRVPGDG